MLYYHLNCSEITLSETLSFKFCNSLDIGIIKKAGISSDKIFDKNVINFHLHSFKKYHGLSSQAHSSSRNSNIDRVRRDSEDDSPKFRKRSTSTLGSDCDRLIE